MGKSFHCWFFPKEMRFLPGIRAVSITLRTLHLAAFGVLLGGHAFSVDGEKLVLYLSLTVVSGIGLVGAEAYAVGLYWFFLGKGLMVLAKLGLLLAVPVFWEQRVALLLVVVVIASVGSHMPARYRHYSVLHRRVIGPEEALHHVIPSRPPAAAAVAVIEDGRPEQR